MTITKTILGTIILSGTFLFGCDSGGAEYVKAVEGFSDKACACKDTDCITKVSKEQADWLSANASKATGLDSGDAEKVTAATTKMTECMTKVTTEAAGAAAP